MIKNNMNLDKINKMKYELIDELTDKQVQLLVESMIVDKYTMNKDERTSNESGLIDIFQYLIDTGKIIHVINGIYGAYNKILYDMTFKEFTFDISKMEIDENGGFKKFVRAMKETREHMYNVDDLIKENQQLKRDLETARQTIDNFDMTNDEIFQRDLELLKEIIGDKE